MAVVSCVVVVDQNYGLGKNNQLLCHLPADLKHFKALTMGKPIIMGSNTFFSIGKPLPGRRNLVLSRENKVISGVEVIPSLASALQMTVENEEVMIIGGAQVFQEALSYTSRIYLTLIEHQFDADVFFPKLDDNAWACVSKVHRLPDEANPYALWFCQYERVGNTKLYSQQSSFR